MPRKKLGFALFCQARPLSDLAIECREIGAAKDMPIKILPCRVQKMERAAPDVMVLHLKLPANERLQFLAGQYIDILMKDGKRRSLSLANAPHDDALLQLHLRNYGGPFSDYVFNRMKEKDILRFEGPLGTFFLREDSDKPIILLASGTGFAPIKAIVEHAIHKGIRRPMTLYWGGRGPRRPLHERSRGNMAARTRHPLCAGAVGGRCPRTTGADAAASCTARWSGISPISPATRSMPAARR